MAGSKLFPTPAYVLFPPPGPYYFIIYIEINYFSQTFMQEITTGAPASFPQSFPINHHFFFSGTIGAPIENEPQIPTKNLITHTNKFTFICKRIWEENKSTNKPKTKRSKTKHMNTTTQKVLASCFHFLAWLR